MKKHGTAAILHSFLFIAWVVIWLCSEVRDFKRKHLFQEYKTLVSYDTAGKRAYTYGQSLLEFLEFCKKNLPVNASYEIAGIEKQSIDERRVVYYLYPFIKLSGSDYLLVFNSKDVRQNGYEMYKMFLLIKL